MKAGVLYGPRDIRFEEVEDIRLSKDDKFDVLVRVKATGVCGSDVHLYNGTLPYELPEKAVMGHELCGEVIEVGEKVVNVKVGDRVGIEPLIGCGKCVYCVSGDYHLCKDLKHIGYFYSGGFAEYTKAPHQNVFKLPDQVSYEEASLLDCYAVGVHALNRVPITVGDSVVIFGAGPMGLCTAQVAQAAGAKKVILIDIVDEVLDIARKAGIEHIFNSLKADVLEEVMKLTNNLGADIVFDCIGGTVPILDLSVAMLRQGGTIGIIGLRQTVSFNFFAAHLKELNIIFVLSYALWDYSTEFEIALDILASGKINATPLITHKFGLEDIKEAFETASNKKESKAVKVVVTQFNKRNEINQ